jgi:hypothetical protein
MEGPRFNKVNKPSKDAEFARAQAKQKLQALKLKVEDEID